MYIYLFILIWKIRSSLFVLLRPQQVTYIAVTKTAHAVNVYTWNGTAFDDFQVFRTNYDPRAVAYFEVDGEKCLGIACHEGGGIQIHRWSGTSFGLWQELDALFAVDLAAFHSSGVFYLAVAEHTENTRMCDMQRINLRQ